MAHAISKDLTAEKFDRDRKNEIETTKTVGPK
jgi:hypothetical protein